MQLSDIKPCGLHPNFESPIAANTKTVNTNHEEVYQRAIVEDAGD